MSTKTTVAHFHVTGEGLTSLARDGMLSERPAWAWRLLADSLVGEGSERMARAVLDGKKKLVGDETKGVECVDDDPNDPVTARYLTDLRYVYAGRVRIRGRWWRPRANVTSFGKEDVGGAMYLRRLENAGVRPSTPREQAITRASHYAGLEEKVFEVNCDGGDEKTCGNPFCGVCACRGYDYVIFEPCSEPPHWWKECSDPTVALHDFKAGGRSLEEEGWVQRYGWDLGAPDAPEPRRPVDDAIDLQKRKCAEAEDEKRHRAFLDECTRIGAEVRTKAAGDTFLLGTKDGRSWSVPRAPFENWALGRTRLRHLAARWEPVSHSGMKLPLDDPFHTDWMLGAGIGISSQSYWDEEIREAASKATVELQQRLGNFKVAVIVDAGEVTGTVGKDVLVVPDMRPERVEAMLAARAVIAEVGGAGSHLAQVGAEANKTIVVAPGAVDRYPPGTSVRISPGEGRIEALDVYLPVQTESLPE